MAQFTTSQIALNEWFAAALAGQTLPAQPFRLKQGVRVSNPAGFYAKIEIQIAEGPASPRIVSGALHDDLACLKEYTEGTALELTPPAQTPPAPTTKPRTRKPRAAKEP